MATQIVLDISKLAELGCLSFPFFYVCKVDKSAILDFIHTKRLLLKTIVHMQEIAFWRFFFMFGSDFYCI